MSDVARAVECPVWAPPLLALQFLTRVPVPWLARLPRDTVDIALGRSVGWFPLVGAFVGALTGATALAAEQIWPRVVAVLIALAIEAVITGAFHEDAVADFFDGIGGGRDPEHMRQIMKDSRIGAYGALGLMLAVALRATLMLSLPLSPLFFFVTVVAAASFGRLTASVAMSVIAPAPHSAPPDQRTSPGLATRIGAALPPGLATRIGAALPPSSLAVAAVTAIPALLPFALLAPTALVLAFAGVAPFLIWFRSLLLRKLGGLTGDCLGLAVYAGQLIVLLVATAS